MWRFSGSLTRSPRQFRDFSHIINGKGPAPYGLSNWEQIRDKGCPYVDRTESIAQLDRNTFHACLWSSRRTGKSLLTNQLQMWHDKVISPEKRQSLFQDTYIGNNPTPEGGKYLVLSFDFSQVREGSIDKNFTDEVNDTIKRFSKKYSTALLLTETIEVHPSNFVSSLNNLAMVVEASGNKVSLIVDEIDSFANRLLIDVSGSEGLSESGYHSFVSREGSVLRDFGRAVKAHSKTVIERMFFTGVMPVAWNDAFSSLNSVEDVTHLPEFQNALGFTIAEIMELLEIRFPRLTITERELHLRLLKDTCNGYRRSPTQVDGLFNPQGVWYYLKQLGSFGENMVPRMDPNIVQPEQDQMIKFLVEHALEVSKYSLTQFFTGSVPFTRFPHFSGQCLFDSSTAPNALLSVGYYCGYLTFQQNEDIWAEARLTIPNVYIGQLIVQAWINLLPDRFRNKALVYRSKHGLRCVWVVGKLWKAWREDGEVPNDDTLNKYLV